ncbi:hypothetical protein IMCC21906_00784 [Spongiibacter sp. IMCC21906]|jgi:uncharacterized protein YgfB (UPF0149 family)|uniref:UPF0149 family protein n=1 Tax=Spongiibacter sp. IMCC21906 TaxID=1620392 RepID=UPI00062DF396|nr:UPF0149 family protein [Spongiibacter sp. IMCC21906]AKH68476.1 hypothetical protein IMCC21906_00784 [Spongiibacter sp. IMCC21906]
MSPDHDELADLFLALGALHPPAELDGYAAGFLSAGGRLEKDAWLKHCGELLDCDIPNPDDAVQLFKVYQAALESMTAGDIALDLLLPGDDFGLDQRIASLGQWCQGFLTGFAMAGKTGALAVGEISEDLSEALSDLAAIAQISPDESGDEDGEQDFFSVCEYVRVAAMSVFLECNQKSRQTAVEPPRLH